MSDTELAYMTCAEQARLIRARKLSPVDLVKTYLDRIERYDHRLRAYITVCGEQALEEARRAEAEIARGAYRGPLHGLVYGVKDQMHVRGVPTTLGTRVLSEAEQQPPCEATVIERLRQAGAIFIGKQNLHEFGKGGTIDFPYGTPRNPWHADFSASSSSSGSGSAPAAGLCSFALGEDTGGSVRGPASCNGVAGLRPTHGRVSRHGAVMWGYNADTIGPLARSVEDVAMVMEVIAGHDPRDPLTLPRPVPAYAEGLDGDVKGLRLAVVREMVRTTSIDPEVLAAFEASLDVLRAQGAVIEEVSLPYSRFAVPLQLLSADADVATMFLPLLRERWDKFDSGTRTRLAAATAIPATVYNRAMRARVIARRQMLDALRSYDGLLCATNVTPPKRIDDYQETVESKDDVTVRLMERRISNYPFNVANVPAISVPMGFSKEGLPLGLQIAANPFDEQMVFRIADAYERNTEWHARHPDLDRTVLAPA